MNAAALWSPLAAVLAAAALFGAGLAVTAELRSADARPSPDERPAPARTESPALAVAVEPDRFEAYPGDRMTLFVTVVNTGGSPLSAVTLTSAVNGVDVEAGTPSSCAVRTLASLAAGQRTRFACQVEAPAAAYLFTARVTARSAAGRTLRDAATLPVGGPRARLSAEIGVTSHGHRPGGTVDMRVRVRNQGAVPAHRVSTVNHAFPGCSKAELGLLAPGEEHVYTCTGTGPLEDTTTALLAKAVTDRGEIRAVSAPAVVDVVHPALVVTGAPSRRGLTLTVTNVGDTPLAAVRTEAPEARDDRSRRRAGGGCG